MEPAIRKQDHLAPIPQSDWSAPAERPKRDVPTGLVELQVVRPETTFPAAGQPTPKRSVWSRIGSFVSAATFPVTSYLFTHLTSLVAFVLFRLLNRTKVYGRFNLSLKRNTLYCPNHRTMIDSYVIGHVIAWPVGFFLKRALVYHPAAKENFFRNKWIGWCSKQWGCIPVQRGVRDFEALQKMTDAVTRGQMIVFPEGTRSRTGELQRGRPGTGKLIYDSGCQVIPIYVRGMDKVLPIGRALPTLFNRIEIHVGKPVDVSDLRELPEGKETSQLIIDRVMEHVTALKDKAEAMAAARLARGPWYQVLARTLRRAALYPVHLVRRN